jgi:hypothetical protein
MWGGAVHGLEGNGPFLEVEGGGAVNLDKTKAHHVRGGLGSLAHNFRTARHPDRHLVRGQMRGDGLLFQFHGDPGGEFADGVLAFDGADLSLDKGVCAVRGS